MTIEPYRIANWSDTYENNRTRELKMLAWVPVPNRMDEDRYTELVDHPNGAAHLGAWIAILLVASKCEPRGTLVRDNGTPHDARSMAHISRLPVAIIEEVLPRLVAIGILNIATIPQEGATIPQEGATIPQEGALNGMEWKGMEGNTNTPAVAGLFLELKPKKAAKTEDGPPGFQRFRAAYPGDRKYTGKHECLVLWEKLGLEAIADEVIAGVERCKRRHPDWIRDSGKCIKGPDVFLRKRDWESFAEVPSPKAPDPSKFKSTLNGAN